MWKLVHNNSTGRRVWHHVERDRSIKFDFEGHGNRHQIEYWDRETGDELDHYYTEQSEILAYEIVFALMEEYQ